MRSNPVISRFPLATALAGSGFGLALDGRCRGAAVPGIDLDRAYFWRADRAGQLDMEQTVVERRPRNLDALGEDEAALELAGGDAAVQVDPVVAVLLLRSRLSSTCSTL
jgi:hypothetical protein